MPLTSATRPRESTFGCSKALRVEVLGDGELGLPNDVLASLDIVVASIHSGLRQGS